MTSMKQSQNFNNWKNYLYFDLGGWNAQNVFH